MNVLRAPRPASPVCTIVSPAWNRAPTVRGILKLQRRTSSSGSIPKAKSRSKKRVQFIEEPSVRVFDPADSPSGASSEEDDDDDDDYQPPRPVIARRRTGPANWAAQVRCTEDDDIVELKGKYPIIVPRANVEAAAARSATGDLFRRPAMKGGLKIDTGVAVRSPTKFGVVMPKEPDAHEPQPSALHSRSTVSVGTEPLKMMRSRSRQEEEDAIARLVRSTTFLRHHLEGPIQLRVDYAIEDLEIDEMEPESMKELADAVKLELEQHSAAKPPRCHLVEEHIEFLKTLRKYILEKCEA
ncbi:hypothetical protein AURDEDRAFT_129338 [Auricularia subglabra TFB-10046 SS5]|uniref:Uncharacterized protein n=1 Tax=Auricularia subglabra (strain TFB-10046 / SS5) TaxID=717982 RepID=J0WUK6_AURST|nr:hypothetical protein AURDEDRAFT_129338 [Auricularia subglabra TFB-10046 SS5]